MNQSLLAYVKQMRKGYGLTQVDLSEKAGVGLRFVRELEQGKETLRMDKGSQVLNLFGATLAPAPIRNLNRKYLTFQLQTLQEKQ